MSHFLFKNVSKRTGLFRVINNPNWIEVDFEFLENQMRGSVRECISTRSYRKTFHVVFVVRMARVTRRRTRNEFEEKTSFNKKNKYRVSYHDYINISISMNW